MASSESAATPPSPPTFTSSFESAVDNHHLFYGCTTRIPHSLRIDDSSSSPTRDWQLLLNARYFDHTGSRRSFTLQDIPSHLVPFFAYKDAAVYLTKHASADGFGLFDTMYQEWYPAREKTVFDNGLMKGGGAPYFGFMMKLDFKEDCPQPPALLGQLLCWHLGFSRHIKRLLPQFEFLADGGGRMLVRPGVQAPPLRHVQFPYTPIIPDTFTQCFIFMDGYSKDKDVTLVVFGDDMLRRLSSRNSKGITQEAALGEQIKQVGASEGAVVQEFGDGVLQEIKIWKGSLRDVMRAVLAGQETRTGGKRDYNPVLEEWLGEGPYTTDIPKSETG